MEMDEVQNKPEDGRQISEVDEHIMNRAISRFREFASHHLSVYFTFNVTISLVSIKLAHVIGRLILWKRHCELQFQLAGTRHTCLNGRVHTNINWNLMVVEHLFHVQIIFQCNEEMLYFLPR